MRVALPVMLAGCLLAGAASAAPYADIRLVRAHSQPGLSSGLHDVADLLKNNIPFQGFTLLGRSQFSLPSQKQTLTMPERLTVRGSGQQERFNIVVERDDETLLNAVVALRPGKPVILGGFPDGPNRLLLVIVLR